MHHWLWYCDVYVRLHSLEYNAIAVVNYSIPANVSAIVTQYINTVNTSPHLRDRLRRSLSCVA
jgi:hypothetical protein